MKKETATYINRIKNQGKHNYATLLYVWLQNPTGLPHPNYHDFGISTMAAQAVEMNLGKLESYYATLSLLQSTGWRKEVA